MEQALKAACPTRRVAHQRATPGNIVRHSAGRFLNRHHLELVARAALISQPSAELSERLALGLRGLAGSAGSAASPSKGTRAVTSALASADESLTDAPADFLPEATNVADDDTPLFMLQVLRGAAEERRSVRASRLVVSTIVAAVNVAKPPARRVVQGTRARSVGNSSANVNPAGIMVRVTVGVLFGTATGSGTIMGVGAGGARQTGNAVPPMRQLE
jgi:hypothetical protein